MTIIFYKTLSEHNRVNKILTLDKTLTGSLKEKTDILNPSIIIKAVNNFNVFDYNYCYISELSRYYYIDSIKIVNAVLYEIELTIDVLMTYKNSILNLECKIDRYSGENENNRLNTSEDYSTTKIDYQYPFTDIDNSSMVLIALNGNSIQ